VADLTAAYTVFANGGVRRQSYIIERIDDSEGVSIYRAAHIQTRAMEAGVAWLTTQAMQKVIERGTAASARSLGFSKPAAGKTGTTDDFRDAWFAGFTSSLTCGVWVGLDQPATIMNRGYGSALALPVWVNIMNGASQQRYPAQALQSAEPTHRAMVCSASNELATTACERAASAYVAELPDSRIPHDACSVHRGGVLADLDREPAQKRSVPQSIFRSFKKFFGGQ
jgi:penicillin-binding protein 1A